MHQQDYLSLLAVNGIPIPTFGNQSLTLYLGLCRMFRWIFIISDVKKPILRADFLRAYNLLVDMRHKRLSDTLTQLNVQGITTHSSSPNPSLLPPAPKQALKLPCVSSQQLKTATSSGCNVRWEAKEEHIVFASQVD